MQGFSFDGNPCEEFGAIVANTPEAKNSWVPVVTRTLLEDRLPNATLFYGYDANTAQNATIVLTPKSGNCFSQIEIDRITRWLMRPNYRDFVYMSMRWEAMCTELKLLSENWKTYGITASFRLKYTSVQKQPSQYEKEVFDNHTFFVDSTNLEPVYPWMQITKNGVGNIQIIANADEENAFILSNVPLGTTITIDNETLQLQSSDGQNAFAWFNLNYIRLKEGSNRLQCNGNFYISMRVPQFEFLGVPF